MTATKRLQGFQLTEDGDDGAYFVSPVYTESDWPVYFVVRVENPEAWEHGASEDVGKYYCEIFAVSMEAAGKEKCHNAAASIGMSHEEFDGLAPEYQAQLLARHGPAARLWYGGGNNLRTLLKQVWEEMRFIRVFFGSAMDRPQNRMGSTGWKFIKGEM